jgi:hypothetical protein
MTEKPLKKVQKLGYNITVRGFQLQPLIDAAVALPDSLVNPPKAEEWMSTKILRNFLGNAWYADIADLVRLLLLYTEGGVYLDTDVLVAKPLDHLRYHIGFQNPDSPNNAVMVFRDKGNAFVGECINEYFANYISNTNSWGYMGPQLLQRVWKRKYKHCQLPDPPQQITQQNANTQIPSCPVVVLWTAAFSPPTLDKCYVPSLKVSSVHWALSYSCKQAHNCRKQTPNRKQRILQVTFVVHLFNKEAKKELETMDRTKLKNDDTLCNWLLNSWCLICDENVWDDF